MCYNSVMDDEYLEDYKRIEAEEQDEDFQQGYVPADESKPKKKHRFGFSNVLLIIYLILHIAYTAYMFTVNWMHALLWLVIVIFELAAFSVILKIQKKVYLIGRLLSFIFVLTLLANSVYSGFILLSSEDNNADGADYALVMGFGLKDGQMEEILELRCDKAVEYLQKNPECTAVLCGGVTRGNAISEAKAMKDYIVRSGIPERRLLLEDSSTNTEENISYAKQMITVGSKVIVISSNYHMHRIKEVCRHAGLNVRAVPCNTPLLDLPDKLMWEKIKLIGMLIDN